MSIRIQETRERLINELRILAAWDETYKAMLEQEIDAYNASYDKQL